jgi:hypothetical protein
LIGEASEASGVQVAQQHFTESLDADLLGSAVDLSRRLGISNFAWPHEAAQRVLQSIRASDWAVLGGDVLRETARDSYEFTGDSWHIERDGPGEAWLGHAKRSHDRATDYIGRLRGGSDLWFVFVCSRGA